MGGQLGQPLRVNGGHVPHVLFVRLHHLVEHQPLRQLLGVQAEQDRGGVEKELVLVPDGAVATAVVEAGGIRKEAGGQAAAELVHVIFARLQRHLEPTQQSLQLISDLHSSYQTLVVQVMIRAPFGILLILEKSIEDVDQRNVITFLYCKFPLLLVLSL